MRSADTPLKVLILGARPIAGLTVDRLTTLAELGAPGTPSVRSAAMLAGHDAHLANRTGESREDVETAMATLPSEGKRVTKAAVSRRAQINRVRAS